MPTLSCTHIQGGVHALAEVHCGIGGLKRESHAPHDQCQACQHERQPMLSCFMPTAAPCSPVAVAAPAVFGGSRMAVIAAAAQASKCTTYSASRCRLRCAAASPAPPPGTGGCTSISPSAAVQPRAAAAAPGREACTATGLSMMQLEGVQLSAHGPWNESWSATGMKPSDATPTFHSLCMPPQPAISSTHSPPRTCRRLLC